MEVDYGACVSLTNATPYRWRKGYSHSYQTHNWKQWPKYIEPGETFSNNPSQKNGAHGHDTAAEVAYHLEGTDRPVSFMVQYRKGRHHNTWIRFLEDLETSNLPKNSEFDLGHRKMPDGQVFILAGKEGDFISTNGPEAWMQSMMDDIGDVPLSEIVMGRSHHAGSYKSDLTGTGATVSNTRCQGETLYKQLRDGGARVLDVRTLMETNGPRKMDFYEWHGTEANIVGWTGSLGASFEEMMEAVNKFNDEFPGELIIFDIHQDAVLRQDKDFWSETIDDDHRNFAYAALLKGLKHRIALPPSDDYTKLPVKDFIGNGTSAVIVRIAQGWVDKDGEEDFPGPSEGFVTTRNFPIQSKWSDTSDYHHLYTNQLFHLRKARGGPTTPGGRSPRVLYDAQWIMTLQDIANIIPAISIMGLARDYLWGGAVRELWSGLTVDQYPSWLTVDAIEGSEFKALIMAMNRCFVARGCGDWADKERSRTG